MIKFARILHAALLVCLGLPATAQFLPTGVINGANTPRRSVFLTFDDGPDERGPDGFTRMEKLAKYLEGPITVRSANPRSAVDGGVVKSIKASFAIVTCHFLGQDKADPNSSMCSGNGGYGDLPLSVANHIYAAGHDIFSHSVNHIPLTTIQDPKKIMYEVGHAQILIDQIRGDSPRVFRAPGLSFSSRVASVLNGSPATAGITGPIDADVGGAFYYGGTWYGGDWDCVALNLGIHFCGDLYVNAIKQAEHGVVVLLHVRTEDMSGTNGNPFPLELVSYIIEHLGPEYEYLPLDAIPGVHGSITTAPAKQVSTDFSPSDGQGVVVAGALNGSGKPASICKARSATVVCKTADGQGGFSAATTLLTIGDPTWTNNFGSAFWLADVNGDGLADLIYPAAGMLWVAFNDGSCGVHPPIPYYAGAIPDPQYIRFGKVAGSKLADMVVWTPDLPAPALYVNNGVRFAAPPAAPSGAVPNGVELPTVQLIDLDGDGRDELVVRGATQVQCAKSTGTGFAALAPCSIAGGPFAQSLEWWNAAYASTFAVAHINGPVLVDGVPTGIIFAPFSHAYLSNRYRYLCNDCFTNAVEREWNPQLRAAQIVWADFTGNGIDSPLFVRADGLYLGLTQVSQ
jgi:peptidoglycan/xylan/chitin deacetylase (PgdA/CDA1 family)